MTHSTKSQGYKALGIASLLLLASSPLHASSWPDKPVTLVVPWGAGGGTDATARMISTLLEESLGVPVPVVNRTGGSGVIGHSAIANATPDGYTIGIATLEIGGMHYQGLTDITYQDYSPIGLYNADPVAIFVSSRSGYDSIDDLLKAIRSSGHREFKASGSAQGGVNHIAEAGMLLASDIPADKVAWVPSEGAAPGLQDLAAGGVDFAAASMPEARALMDAGLIKPLVILNTERSSNAPDLPTFEEATGNEWSFGSWRGLVGPADVDEEIISTLQEHMSAIVNDPTYLEFMNNRGYATLWLEGDEFMDFMQSSDQRIGATLKSLGIVE
ncbi:tripartite tricarboxylate transporter substrate binding protein [Halomonas campaniensis]|uniref:ABC transporter substrate-binding protein n=1 Tax=Halomonas campaniensis TaxID=213554 RepID=A0A246S2H0_9GAMM|nr:tripartite tricarboxylate transporter substrate binding protein [Halomonas campaniensis]OWV30618.1 ABC transporter substrate-binding protein [Halomonas campaniensis]